MIWPGPVAAQLAAHVARDAVAARRDRRLLLRQLAAIQEIAELLARSPPGCTASRVAEPGLVVLERSDPRTSSAPRRSRRPTRRASSRGTASASASSAACSQLTMPRSIGRLRPMSSCDWIDADVARVGPEGELADRRHAVLADQDHEVGAGERRRRRVGRQRAGVRELALHRAGLDDRNLRLLGERASARPRPWRRRRRCSTR